MKNRHKSDGLVSKVLIIPHKLIKRDEYNDRYIPWCDFGFHLGIIKDEEICLQRNCSHYYKLYMKKYQYDK